MKAIQFNFTIPRYALGLALGKIYPPLLWSGLSCTYADDIPEPILPGDQWVKVKTRFGGICGTDVDTIHLNTSPYYSPFSSFPFTIGHENLGHIAEVGSNAGDWKVGERVIVEPLLWCKPRGFTDLCEYCARGETNRCLRFTEGDLSPGILMGACADTGGSWSQYYLSHSCQVYRLPENISDENALMIEPFAIGLHAALLDFPKDNETVLIIGAGTIGLVQLAALRVLGSKAKILVSARHPFQAEAARKLGASEVLTDIDLYTQVAEATLATMHKPLVGKRVMVGGVARVYECIGSDRAIDDAIRLARPGGKVMLVGIPAITKSVDWTAIFSQELEVRASSNYNHVEPYQGKEWKAFALTIDLMTRGKLDLGWMVTHRYKLDQYAKALRDVANRKRIPIIKPVFEFE